MIGLQFAPHIRTRTYYNNTMIYSILIAIVIIYCIYIFRYKRISYNNNVRRIVIVHDRFEYVQLKVNK
jgi:hypothetical protein